MAQQKTTGTAADTEAPGEPDTTTQPDTADQSQASERIDDQEPDTGESENTDDTDWKSESEKWKALSRKHQERTETKNTEIEQLRQQVAEQATAAVENASTLAAERLHVRLARAGISTDDAESLIDHIDPTRLLKDGSPSTAAIDALAASLTRSLGRGIDDDQGKRSDEPAFSPDQWLRNKARK